jgi:multiple sugar transport system permease protein
MSRFDRVLRVARWVFLAFWVVITGFPLYWTVTTSLKPVDEWMSQPISWIPKHLTLSNYAQVLLPNYHTNQNAMLPTTANALGSIGNSVIVGLGGTALALVLGLAAAYAISRYRFGGKNLPFSILNVRMFPPIAALIPLLVMFSNVFHLIDTYWCLILVDGGFAAPFAVWLTKSFIDEVPRELEEAARIDGYSELGAAIRVVIPSIMGGLATTALFIFIIIWSDFVVAFTLAGQNVITAPVRLQLYNTATAGQLYGPQAALGVVVAIPVVILGISIQKYLARGLTFGAIKR